MHPAASDEWCYGEHQIAHRSDRFFSIVALDFLAAGHRRRQLFIDQPEVGTLAFLLRTTPAAREALVQFKAEPGNVHGVQVAPTCQATASNLSRVHGGSAPTGFELADAARQVGTVLADTTQSEQGSRFFRKRNRNVTLDLGPNAGVPASTTRDCAWVPLTQLLPLLRRDFVVNTDARSVLVTTPWASLCTDPPFSLATGTLGGLLRTAYGRRSAADTDESGAQRLVWLAERQRAHATQTPERVAVTALPGFALDRSGVAVAGHEFSVRHVRVRIADREREAWDQPLIQSHGEGLCRLVGLVVNGDVRFVLRATAEPGLASGVELHPTIVRRPGAAPAAPDADAYRDATVVLSTRQSEEGGRFLFDCNRHEIALATRPDFAVGPEEIAVTVGELEYLARAGVLTNEARSTVSLLPSYC